MTLEEIKEKMLAWHDFYGGELTEYDRINGAITKYELRVILEDHRTFMEDMLSDAHSHIDNFQRELGLF